MGNTTTLHLHREDHDHDTLEENPTVMAIYIRNSHHMPGITGVLVQAVLFIISFIYTVIGVSVMLKFTIFHKNVRNMFISLLLLWFELLTCRVFLWFFKYNFAIEIKEAIACNDECHHFGRCSLSTNIWDPIFIAALMRYHYMFFVMSTPIGILTERVFATVLVQDYEKKGRPWIFVSILVCQHLFAGTMSIISSTTQLHFSAIISAVIILMILSAVIYGFVEFFNKRRLSILEKEHRNTNYTLSIRYQLKENLKTLRLMRRFFIAIIIIIIAMGLANSLPVILGFHEEIVLKIRVYMDYVFHSNPVFLVPTAMFTIEHYRKYLLNAAKKTFGIRVDSKKINNRKLKSPSSENETNVYFRNFERQLEGSPKRDNKK